ncbi:hypothetical protein NDK25_24420 [Niallia taxi]|nr:hypothetical protein [Niallia taxi]MDE5055367.1 hypothetical protein [Niallia taxi]
MIKCDSRKIERKFQRRLKKRGAFYTVNGAVNYLKQQNKNCIYICTSKGQAIIQIKRETIRKCIDYFFHKRTVIRKDMEQFSAYSSSLFAIIWDCFSDVSKIQKLNNNMFRISLVGTRVYFSGLERSPGMQKIVKEQKGDYLLYNYYSITQSSKDPVVTLEENQQYCIIDSGAFSFYNAYKKEKQQICLFSEEIMQEMYLDGFIDYINKHKDNARVLGFITLDVIGDEKKTIENYRYIKQRTNAEIIPVWQITGTIEYLSELVAEEHAVICLGGMVPFISKRKEFLRERLGYIKKKFPTQNFHFLGVADELLKEYGAFSSDSTAYLNARKYDDNKIYTENGYREKAPTQLSKLRIIEQNIRFLAGLEEAIPKQINFLV